tara:strand:+ start:763 stop:987 length:225 start_codon:yes stop_codon:yes gene_type:complete
MGKKEKGKIYDGRSRPSNDLYKKNFDRIFKTNPIAKEVRTSKFKSQVIDSKKIYDRKKEQVEIEEYLEELKHKL